MLKKNTTKSSKNVPKAGGKPEQADSGAGAGALQSLKEKHLKPAAASTSAQALGRGSQPPDARQPGIESGEQ